MKIALLADSHFGIRSDAATFLDLQEKFYRDVFFPAIDEHEITQIIHLGDYFDRRKFINFNTFDRSNRMFIEPIVERGISMDLIIGNHDTFFKNSNRVNSPQLMLGDVPKLKIYVSRPETQTYDGLEIGLVPWICDENEAEITKFLKQTTAEVIMGHFELAGFETQPGHVMEHGMSKKVLQHFELVCSGHYHHRSSIGNIHYLGSPHEATWADFEDPRGFHIFDTATQKLTFIESPHKLFFKFAYDDSDMTIDGLAEHVPQCSGQFVRIVVEKKTDPYMFDQFLELLQKQNPADLTVIEDSFRSEMDDDDVDLGKDTLHLLTEYVSAMNLSSDEEKDQLKSLFRVMYLEAGGVILEKKSC